MSKESKICSLCVTLMVLAAALPPVSAGAEEYLVIFKDSNLPADAGDCISKAGGVMANAVPMAGIALAKSDDPDFLEKILLDSTVQTAGLDQKFALRPDTDLSHLRTLSVSKRKLTKPLSLKGPADAEFFDFQWNMKQIQADLAWADGVLGDPDVVVALVESGIDYTHPELVGKVDLSLSVSFVPEEDEIIAERYPGMHPSLDLNIGGTMAAGIISCNGVATACIAPNATLVSVKTVDALSVSSGFRQIQGIMYSAMIGADIIAASFGGNLEYSNPAYDAIFTGFVRAVNMAEQLGSLVVAGVGGIARLEGLDADQTLLTELFPPAQMTVAIGVAGTTPLNQEDFDGRATWTNWGNTLVDMVAPAGRIDGDFFDQILGPCTAFSDVVPQCMVIEEDDESDWTGFATTNFPMAHVAGAAALIKSVFGDLTPAQIRERLFLHVVDLGEPGRDRFFGHGRLHAFNVLK